MIEVDNKRYVIKMSTHKYERYYKEGLIYRKFNEIMNDPNEPEAEIIKGRVLNSYYFGNIIAKHTDYQVNMTPKLAIIVSNTLNTKLWLAIKHLSELNDNIDQVYYIITENILGEWDILQDIELDTREKCLLIPNIFSLLSYLNTRYNFVHWDLHDQNILINNENHKIFKIFDFDHSEITYRDNSTNINNHLLNTLKTIYSININTSEPIYTDKNMRKDFGLIYDINRVLDDLVKFNCIVPDLVNFLRTKQKIDFANKDNTEIETVNKFHYLFVLSQKMFTEYKINDMPIADWIRYRFNINRIARNENLTGGGLYFKKYQKYKSKYLNLKNN